MANTGPEKEPTNDVGRPTDANVTSGASYGYWDGGVYRHDYRDAVIWSRDGKCRGVSTGGRRPCSCHADRIYVRWDDGDRSWPCIKALEHIGNNEFRIL